MLTTELNHVTFAAHQNANCSSLPQRRNAKQSMQCNLRTTDTNKLHDELVRQ